MTCAIRRSRLVAFQILKGAFYRISPFSVLAPTAAKGHEDQFPPPSLNARSVIRKQTVRRDPRQWARRADSGRSTEHDRTGQIDPELTTARARAANGLSGEEVDEGERRRVLGYTMETARISGGRPTRSPKGGYQINCHRNRAP